MTAMRILPRREFLKASLLTGAAATIRRAAAAPAVPAGTHAPGIVDTNVTLFRWPFRRLKYDDTAKLVAKLRRHRVVEAWAGSFEALMQKDLAGVNERLAAECHAHGAGFLRPIGSVNLAWPEWEDDLRRIHEQHRMPGVRIFPGYQPFDLSHPDVPRLLQLCRERGLLLQVVFQMEDPRVHHPLITLPTLDSRPLATALKASPGTRVQLLHFTGNVQATDLRELMSLPDVSIDISRWESNGMVGKMIGATRDAPTSANPRVPLDRVLFGSHAPYFPLETAILKLVESPLTAEQVNAIMHLNARRVLPA